MFLIAAFIIGLAASAITAKTLIGYASLKWWWKLLVCGFVCFCWFGHIGLSYARHHGLLPLPLYNIAAVCVYVSLGFGFILLTLLLLRDFAWFLSYGIAKMGKLGCCAKLNPFEIHYLNIANVATVVLAALLTAYGMFEALKFPAIKEITLADAKITVPAKIVLMSDLHINRTVSSAKVGRLVEKVNAMRPDVILIAGDIVDEAPNVIKEQIETLARLKAKDGTFIVFGNHDFYSGMLPWLKRFTELKFGVLFNNGVLLPNNLFIAGIPDKSIERMSNLIKIDLPKALHGKPDNAYTILMSHTPAFQDEPVKGIDLQVSGHTHGGQIFPFHFLVKAANKYLAGLYNEDGYKVYVSRGAGFWGPPIRLFAPSDITVFNLIPKP